MEVIAPATQKKGWQATLELCFQHQQGKTVLTGSRHSGPLTVQRPFYPEGSTCHLYLLHPPGGIAGGDELNITLRLEENSHALITMPGATKFYRSAGPRAGLSQHLYVGEDATLEWLPLDAILFPGANADIRSVFHLSRGSHLLAWDLLCLGRPVINETFSHGYCHNRLEVWKEGEPLLVERLNLQDGQLQSVAGCPWIGTQLFYPATEALLDAVRKKLQPLGDKAGATLIDELLLIRFLAEDNLICQHAMREIWELARPLITGKQPHPPGIWNT